MKRKVWRKGFPPVGRREETWAASWTPEKEQQLAESGGWGAGRRGGGAVGGVSCVGILAGVLLLLVVVGEGTDWGRLGISD